MFRPTSINDSEGKPLFLTSSTESAERHHVVGFGMQDDRAGLHRRRRSPSLPRRAEQHQRRCPRVDVHRHGTAPAGADDDIGLMPVEFGLGDADGGIEIVVGQGRIQDLRGRGP